MNGAKAIEFMDSFPSPCGDVVLKYLGAEKMSEWVGEQVSVPLRGCGFEINYEQVIRGLMANSFRPLAGMWF